MDTDRAHRRRAELEERLARIEKYGHPGYMPTPARRPSTRTHCAGAVHGQHGPASHDGLCPYCGYLLPRPRRPEPTNGTQVRTLHPVTLEPLPACVIGEPL